MAVVGGAELRVTRGHTGSPHAELQDSDDRETARKHTTTDLVMHIGPQPCTVTVGEGSGGGGGAGGGGVESLNIISDHFNIQQFFGVFFGFLLAQEQDENSVTATEALWCPS